MGTGRQGNVRPLGHCWQHNETGVIEGDWEKNENIVKYRNTDAHYN